MRLSAALLGLAIAAAGLTTGCEPAGSGSCRSASAAAAPAVDAAAKPRPKPKQTADRKPVCSPSTSKIWKSFKAYRGNIRTNGESGSKRRFYTWDYTHGDIEVWNGAGSHLGSMDPQSGKMTKPPVKGRDLKGVR